MDPASQPAISLSVEMKLNFLWPSYKKINILIEIKEHAKAGDCSHKICTCYLNKLDNSLSSLAACVLL
jgi:hypothetical protein